MPWMPHRLKRLILPAAILAPTAMADLPAGFSVETVASGLRTPVSLAFAPDGRMFVAQHDGTVRVFGHGLEYSAPFAQIAVFEYSESGLSGMALDPDFAVNHFVYFFATISDHEQQIIRYTDVLGVGADPVVVRGSLPTVGANHNGGGLGFGPDGYLYFSVGDNETGVLAQEFTTLAGKISRISRDGAAPDDNPFTTATGVRRSIWALGFRNPFRFTFAPDGRMFVLDVGSEDPLRREEVNLVRAADNGGWPIVEGEFDADAHPNFLKPLYAYKDHGSAPSGICYYTGSQFPAEYRGSLFYLDFVSNRIFRITLSGDELVQHDEFFRGAGGLVDLIQGPDGCLYFCQYIRGRVQRICFVNFGPKDVPTGLSGEDPHDEGTADPTDPLDDSTQSDSLQSGNGGSTSPWRWLFPGCGAGSLSAAMCCGITLTAFRRRRPRTRR